MDKGWGLKVVVDNFLILLGAHDHACDQLYGDNVHVLACCSSLLMLLCPNLSYVRNVRVLSARARARRAIVFQKPLKQLKFVSVRIENMSVE